jgi:hypothetical protein
VDAAPGEKLTVVWALAGTDEHGRRQPFNAIGVFVRLLSATGGRPTIGFATPDAHPQGRDDAQVAVPKGGIGGVQIGLRGASDGEPSDVVFPLANDPFALEDGSQLAHPRVVLGLSCVMSLHHQEKPASAVPGGWIVLPL